MADVIGEAFVAIRPDVSGFQREAETGVKSGIGKLAAGLGGLFIADKIGEGLKSVIGAGSDLNETISKTRAVFGDSAEAALKYGDNAATALREPKQAALEQLSTLGNLFVSLGLGRGKALDMGKGMVSLAADLGSFNNVPTDEALEAIRSGLVGETEPLRRFGVNMNEATLKAKALELGISDGTAVLTPAQKAQAAYALIMDQTKTAQGDAARTAGEAAGQQKILAARMEDIKAKIGTALLPLYNKLLNIGQQVVTWLSEHKTVAKALAVVIGTALVGAVYAWVASMVAAAAATIAATWPVLAIIAAVAALAAGVYLLVTNWDTVWGKIKDIAASVWDWLSNSFFGKIIIYGIFPVIGAIKLLAENWDTIWGAIKTVLQVAWDVVLKPIFDGILTAFGWIVAGATIIKGIWDGIFAGLQTAWDTVGKPVLDTILTVLGPIIEAARTLKDLFDTLFSTDRGAYSGGRIPHPGNYATAPEGATGGIVTRPTLALIGEAGPEAVVPLNRTPGSSPLPGGWGGGDALHFHFDRMPDNPFDFAVKVAKKHRHVARAMAR